MSELVYLAFGPAPVDYVDGWDLQRRVHARRVADEVPDSCLLLEHAPVYTAGKRTAASDRPFGDPGAPVIDVDRGGKITWHGPGQLTGYPIIKLRRADRRGGLRAGARGGHDPDLRGVRRHGRAGGRAQRRVDHGGRAGRRGPGGVAERKVGAIGARVAKGVTMHGFALNCDCDLSWYDRIVPCGIRDAGVSTLSIEAGRHSPWPRSRRLQRHLADVLGYDGWRVVYDVDALAGPADLARPPPRRVSRRGGS